MKIGKIEIHPYKNHDNRDGYFLSNDGEGMWFAADELEEILKEILYKHF